MNKIFAEHVTNTAFFLSVSKKQIRYLDILFKTPWPHRGYYDRDQFGGRGDPDNWISSYRALERKGLVVFVAHMEESIRGPVQYHHYELTKAGQLLCEMLIEAGMLLTKQEEQVAA